MTGALEVCESKDMSPCNEHLFDRKTSLFSLHDNDPSIIAQGAVCPHTFSTLCVCIIFFFLIWQHFIHQVVLFFFLVIPLFLIWQ